MADPLWINASAGAPAYTAAELRRAFAALLTPKVTDGTNRFGAVEGIRPGSGVVVSLAGSTITVKAHAGVISPDLTSTQGAYVYQLPADETHTLTAPHATLSRTDLVTMRVDDNDEDSSGSRQATSAYVVGTAGGGVPSLPARSWELARIAVPNSGGGSPSLTERQKYSVANGGVLPVRDSSDFPTHYEGRLIYEMNNDRLLMSDGANWRLVSATTAAGRAGVRLRRAANQSIPNASSTAISWDTEDQDTNGYIAVSNTVVTIPAALDGLYAITAVAEGAFTTGRAFIEAQVTSAITGLPDFFRAPMEAAEDRGLLTITIPLLVADTLQFNLLHSTGSSVNFTAFLSMYRLSA